MTAAHIRRRHNRDAAAARAARIDLFLARVHDGRDLTLPERQQFADDIRATQAAAAHSRDMAKRHQQSAQRTKTAADQAVAEIEQQRDEQYERAEKAVRRAADEYDRARDGSGRLWSDIAAEYAEAAHKAEDARAETSRISHEYRNRAEAAQRDLDDHRGAISHALGLGTSAPWDAIHGRAGELRTINGRWADWLTAIRQTVGAGSFAETPAKTKQLANDYGNDARSRAATEDRLKNAHNARRNKEAQLDDVRRALCDTGVINDDDPYSHADLADVIRQWHQGGNDLAKQRDLAERRYAATERQLDDARNHLASIPAHHITPDERAALGRILEPRPDAEHYAAHFTPETDQ